MHAHQALGHAHGALVALVVLHQFAQVDGAENCTRVLRPRISTVSSRRKRPVTAQLSANSSFHGLDSLAGVWPQNTLTG